jgi:predicted nicotinamide N-methyase
MEDGVFFREVLCSGKTLKVKQLYIGDVGCVVWDAALVLCRFLENQQYFPWEFWSGKSVVELGAGTGVVGLAAGTLGADVIVTDLAECVTLMRSNIELNKDCITGRVTARSLVWYNVIILHLQYY